MLLLLAQVITIAALARAAYLAFYRPRGQAYERFDRLHPGMVVALWTIAGASVAFGVLPGWVVSHIGAPAAGSLLHAASYSQRRPRGRRTDAWDPLSNSTIRMLHTGSVNDYAAFAVVGVVCSLAVLAR